MSRARGALLCVAVLAGACGDADRSSDGAAPPTSTTSAVATSAEVTTPPPAPTSSAAAVAPEEVTAAIEPVIDAEALARHAVPGVVVVVLRDGEVVASIASGVDPATGEPLTVDTVFQVGSISKPVTAMAVAALVDDGALGWDDDIRDHLRSFELRAEHTAPITVAQLLAHTAGTTVDGFVGYPADGQVPTVPELLGGEGNSPEVFGEFEPGVFSYSGGGYTLLQQALVDLTGTDFSTLLDELVLSPAGTTTATFDQPLSSDRRSQATAGSIGGQPVEPFVYPEQAAAGLWATGPDIARILVGFQRALRGEADWSGADAAAFLVEPSGAGGPGLLTGHGFFVTGGAAPEWFWHSGRNTGYNAELIGSVDGRHGLVVLTNALDAGFTIQAVVDAVAEVEQWDGFAR